MMLLAGKRQKDKGFLLFEIMISISILSLGITLILSSFISPIRAIEFSKNYFKAGILLEKKLLEFYNSGIEEGVSMGEFSDFDNKFSWHMDAVRLEKNDFSCKEVKLKVLWRERGREKDLSVSIYI